MSRRPDAADRSRRSAPGRTSGPCCAPGAGSRHSPPSRSSPARPSGCSRAPLLGRIVDVVVSQQRAGGDPATPSPTSSGWSASSSAWRSSRACCWWSRCGWWPGSARACWPTCASGSSSARCSCRWRRSSAAGSGDLTSRVTNDVAVVAEGVREAFPEFARSALAIGLTLVGMAVLDWRFLLAALVAVPVQAWTVRWYVRRAGPLYARQRAAVGVQQQSLLEHGGRRPDGARVRARRRPRRPAHPALARRGRPHAGAASGCRPGSSAGSTSPSSSACRRSSSSGSLLVRDGGTTRRRGATAAALYFHGLFGPINTALILIDDDAGGAREPRPAGRRGRPAGDPPGRDAGAAPRDASVRIEGAGARVRDGPRRRCTT